MLTFQIDTSYISRFSENEASPLKRYLFTDRYISNFDSKYDYKMSRVCLRFEFPLENTDSKSLIFRSYRRYRRYRWTGYFGGSVYQCSGGGHETKVYITDGVLIYPSVRAEKNFTDGKLPLPSVPSVPMDKVFEGYLMPLE